MTADVHHLDDSVFVRQVHVGNATAALVGTLTANDGTVSDGS